MTLNERRDLYYWNLTPDAALCTNCKHFIRHYIKGGPMHTVSMVSLDCGHCVFPRTKLRKAYDICGYFQNKKTALQATEERSNEK